MNFVIPVPIYKAPVSVTTDQKTYNKWREDHGFAPMHPTSMGNAGYMEYKGDEFFILYVPIDISPGGLAHECLHVAGYILESRGVPYGPKPENDEALAYLVEYLVNQVHRKLKCNQRRSGVRKGQKQLSKKQSSRS